MKIITPWYMPEECRRVQARLLDGQIVLPEIVPYSVDLTCRTHLRGMVVVSENGRQLSKAGKTKKVPVSWDDCIVEFRQKKESCASTRRREALVLVHKIIKLYTYIRKPQVRWQVYVETLVDSKTIYLYCHQTNTLTYIQGKELDEWFKKAALAARLSRWSRTPLVSRKRPVDTT